ncbi:hypothetical protein ACA910_011502 [Epithemia clementina (nom. ined.)]
MIEATITTTSVTQLPGDLFVQVLSNLDIPSIVACTTVNKAFNKATQDPELWKAAAIAKFGPKVAYATVHLYDVGGNNNNANDGVNETSNSTRHQQENTRFSASYRSWRAMVMDDNRLGALPTCFINAASSWKWNSEEIFYACILHSVQWDRVANELRVYIDARGERDLRHPRSSTLVWRGIDNSKAVNNAFGNTRRPTRVREKELRLLDWQPNVSTYGHFKGCLIYDLSRCDLDNPSGCLAFIFACPNSMGMKDYANLLIDWDFRISANTQYAMLDESPFAHDTLEEEVRRWRPVLPSPNLLPPLQVLPHGDGHSTIQRRDNHNPTNTRRTTPWWTTCTQMEEDERLYDWSRRTLLGAVNPIFGVVGQQLPGRRLHVIVGGRRHQRPQPPNHHRREPSPPPPPS